MNTAHDVCNALRSGNLSHNDLEVVLACLANSLQFSDLSDYSSKVVVDLLDEIIGQVEDDELQQQEAAKRGVV